jgi:hypothetical protein
MEAVTTENPESTQRQPLWDQLIPRVENATTLISLVIIALCFGLMASFWFARITPSFLLAFGLPILCALVYCTIFRGRALRRPRQMTGRGWIYAIVLVCLVITGLYLRYPTSAHIHGGQDQGSYFNMAAWIADHGTYERHDKLLSDAFRQKWPFAFNLIWNPYENQGKPQKDIPGEYEGERFVGGFTVKSREEGKVVPQFYPLTALLLTTGHWIFGAKHTSDILPIFGILSVISAGLLAYRMFKSRFVAVLVFITLLFSGLQVFFSTFPVSEMISQYFLMTGIWLVLRAMEEESRALPLLAGLNFTAALFNHVSTLFYLVPIVIFIVLHRMASESRAENRQILIFYYTFLAGITVSLISARLYNGYYVYRNLIENLNFLQPLDINHIFLLLFAAVLAAAVAPLVFHIKKGKRLLPKPQWVKWIIFSIAATTVLIIMAKTILFHFNLTDSPNTHYTFFSSITAHISSAGWILLLFGIFSAIFRENIRGFLMPLLVLLWTSFLFLYLTFLTEYQWYFARYYVKEFYPLAIMFMAYGIFQIYQYRLLKNIPGKALTPILALSLILYSAHPNLYIFKKPFLNGAYDVMTSLDSKIKDNAIVFLVPGRDMFAPPDSELRLSVPLVYSFGHNVIWLPLNRELPQMIQIVSSYLKSYKRPLYVLYVGAQPLPRNLLSSGYRHITSQLHEFTEPERANGIPKQHHQIRMGIHLYEL